MLHLLRASAGAGKTHQLVQIYLQYILASPACVPQVVVLSFTNKATQELKQRILAQLYELSEGKATAMAKALKERLDYDGITLAKHAKEALNYILEHYDAFAVYTIDTFFQNLLRSFSYELQIATTYELLLEQNQLLDSCVTELLQQLPDTPVLQEALTDLAIQKITEGKAWHFRGALLRWGEDLMATFNEPVVPTPLEGSTPSTNLLEVLKQFSKEAAVFVDTLAKKASEALAHIRAAGLEAKDFTWGEKGVFGFFKKLYHKEAISSPSSRIVQASQDATVWVSKKSPRRAEVLTLVESTLQPLLVTLLEYHMTHYTRYATIKTLLPLRYRLLTIEQLKERILAYTRRHETVLINTVPQLIKDTLQGSTAAYLYGKTGMQPCHFLIDESQDISTAQWQGIAPLLKQTLWQHHESWLVGDAKQAIYRWRGGNPQLLLTQVEKEMGRDKTCTTALRHNWRSKRAIVAFNNAFFAEASRLMTAYLQEELKEQKGIDTEAFSEEIAHIEKAYAQVLQELPPSVTDTSSGYVHVRFISSEQRGNAWKEEAIQQTIHTIEELQRKGYSLADITLLVRNNAEARQLLDAFLAHQKSGAAQRGMRYEAVASAALALAGNPYVNLLMSALRYLHEPDDQVALATLVHLYQQYVQGTLHRERHSSLSEGSSGAANAYFLTLESFSKTASYLPDHFFEQRKDLKRLPLYPLVTRLMHLFDVERVASASYLSAFKEVVYKFSLRTESSLPDFLLWWDKYGAQEVAPAPATEDAMKIMTIHQAKGLAFKVVLVPFCAWELDHTFYNPPVITGSTSQQPFDKLQAVQLTYSPKLKETYYAEAYVHEKWQQYLEQLNLLYVALTRARDACYVVAPYAQKPTLKTTAHLLQALLQPGGGHPQGALQAQGRWDEETLTWESGVLPTPLLSQAKALSRPKVLPTYPMLPEQYTQVTKRIAATHEEGIWWHDLLSEITTVASVSPLLAHYVKSNRLSIEKAREVEETLKRLFEDPRVCDWFSGRWKIYAERTIVLPSGQLWRPDRVMTCDDQAVILDFKLGSPLSAHHKQVRAYMDIVAKVGYTQVEGYLLYLSEGQLIEVT